MTTELFTNKRVLGAGLATAVTTWLYDFAVHGHLLKDLYEANKRLFRPEAQMMELGHWCIAYHLVIAVLVAGAYSFWRSKTKTGKVGSATCPYRCSIGFGVWVGLLFAVPQLMTYVWLPLPNFDLPQAWAIAELVKWVVASAVLTKVYDWQNSK